MRDSRTIEVKTPAELPYFTMGWKTPVVNTAEEVWQTYALEVLAGILDGGSSSRFARDLVRGEEVAASVGAGYGLFSRLEDMFLVVGTPAQAKTIKALQQAVMKQIEKIQNELVDEQELQRIKVQVVANAVYERDSVFYQAMQIGMLETIGLDWHLSDDYVENVQAVTAEQVQAVAKKYLIDDSLTIAELIPLPITEKKMRSAGGRHGR